jgi:hypothetical protein
MANFCRKPDYSKGTKYTGKSTSGKVTTDKWITMEHMNGTNYVTGSFYLSKDGSNWIIVSKSHWHSERGNTSGCSMHYVPKGWSYKLESSYNQQLTFWECI